ncbi:MAG: RusA family crossover junction endodeoxyribonuclease [Sulfitobacter sp.]|uniref:RusA family crossover junction endodeoxyribonuclease n=1 Tax=Alphaproteobacteria TaxID=28211 RepID=UPI0029436242|nr:RusA family crossover junction endodeoxyribonuclease [Sulfitobacter sp. LC.270.F.C4]WOI13524.1 RusA family crossover junction endodeoxyribonuclease [Sulfitobacter sp. LC.270.F.C4]
MRFVIPGKPFAKQRPRFAKGRTYTPAQTVSFERVVGEYAMAEKCPLLDGPVRLKITAIFEPAKSWSKKRREAALWGPHTQKPDLDNIEKAILDGLDRIAFNDDSQVCMTESRKMWGSEAQTIVEVTPLTTFPLGGAQ